MSSLGNGRSFASSQKKQFKQSWMINGNAAESDSRKEIVTIESTVTFEWSQRFLDSLDLNFHLAIYGCDSEVYMWSTFNTSKHCF